MYNLHYGGNFLHNHLVYFNLFRAIRGSSFIRVNSEDLGPGGSHFYDPYQRKWLVVEYRRIGDEENKVASARTNDILSFSQVKIAG